MEGSEARRLGFKLIKWFCSEVRHGRSTSHGGMGPPGPPENAPSLGPRVRLKSHPGIKHHQSSFWHPIGGLSDVSPPWAIFHGLISTIPWMIWSIYIDRLDTDLTSFRFLWCSLLPWSILGRTSPCHQGGEPPPPPFTLRSPVSAECFATHITLHHKQRRCDMTKR